MDTNDKMEILEAIGLLAVNLQDVSDRLDRNEINTARRFDVMEKEIKIIKSQMVTKSYLDDKLADLKGDLIAISKKLNTKLGAVVERLVLEGLIKPEIANQIMALEPFPVV